MANEPKDLNPEDLSSELNRLKWLADEYWSDYNKATNRYIEAEVVSDSLRSENEHLKNRLYDLEQVAVYCRKQLDDLRLQSSRPHNRDELETLISLDHYSYTAYIKVKEFFRDEVKTNSWWKTPNPLLGDVSPKDMCEAGRGHKLLLFVKNMLSENQKE